jgi:hypothetical protein
MRLLRSGIGVIKFVELIEFVERKKEMLPRRAQIKMRN